MKKALLVAVLVLALSINVGAEWRSGMSGSNEGFGFRLIEYISSPGFSFYTDANVLEETSLARFGSRYYLDKNEGLFGNLALAMKDHDIEGESEDSEEFGVNFGGGYIYQLSDSIFADIEAGYSLMEEESSMFVAGSINFSWSNYGVFDFTETKYTMISPETDEDYYYEDEILTLEFTPVTNTGMFSAVNRLEGIAFELNNKTDSSIYLLWDEVTFIHPNNSTSNVIHEGVRYADRNKSMPPATIPSNSYLKDSVYPANLVSWDDGWEHSSIMRGDEDDIGKKVGVLMPIEVDGERQEYKFEFELIED